MAEWSVRCPATYRSRVRVVLVFKLEEEYRKHQDFQDFRFKTSYVEISQIFDLFCKFFDKMFNWNCLFEENFFGQVFVISKTKNYFSQRPIVTKV